MRKVSRTVNRVLLGLTGLVLIGVGGTVLLGGLDLPGKWGFGMPSGWRWSRPDDVLLRAEDRTRWTDSGWWWPVVIAVLAVLVLLALWWLLSQFRRHRLGEVLVDSGDGEGAQLRGRAMESVLTAETETLDGVDRARVRLTGRRTEPRLRAGLALAPHANPCAVVARLSSETIAHARTSAGLEKLPAEVRLRAVKHRAERVS
ncbi:alkaline shock response membrane anchor protein AmaP [Streptomyces albofaciens JCM 4342]|uniref:alkaline shock response membrane anchor protein AmaP n=1 Tax=Streptomyces albofaciens TaxID=66866 RepID=UPI00123C6AAB|nr:alkaline shock response membrane anchor protein AmaP [Streptomyces albofaciens]KAA6222625.1 alkaline shock response membrane anchor protein AmaP [Streptomyces albofaciens JCM 4342]